MQLGERDTPRSEESRHTPSTDLGCRRIQRDVGNWQHGASARTTATLDLRTPGVRRATTYEGFAGVAADTSIERRIALRRDARSAVFACRSVALCERRARRCSHTDVGGADRAPAEDGQFGAVKFAGDGSRLYASRFGHNVVLGTSNGEELHDRGSGLIAVSPDGRRIAVRDGSLGCGSSTRSSAPHTTYPCRLPAPADSARRRKVGNHRGRRVVVVGRTAGPVEPASLEGVGTPVESTVGELVTAGAEAHHQVGPREWPRASGPAFSFVRTLIRGETDDAAI